MLLDAGAVSPFPDHLDFDEAATLPCAALTAWRAVAEEAAIGPGQTLLVQGTGGVSLFALQFAKARGAHVIITSSSDEKLERARGLGADFTINYKANPEWSKEVRRLTDGRGADAVIEVGGADTLAESMKAAAVGGSIVVIGILSGAAASFPLPVLFGNNLRVAGISVGNRSQFEAMCCDIAAYRIRPVIDRTFDIARVQDALRRMEGGRHFGKIVLRF